MECVAELMKRPLLALTCGDPGTDVVAVESKLKKYMSWGEIWNGFMFLTTNRVGTFHDAFLSRIHVCLLYKALTDEDREKIWSIHFERLKSEKVEPAMSVHPDAELYVSGAWKKNNQVQRDVIDIQWNGREIRNG
jgi:hypothetical protein